jgi:hypothetical protein
VTSPHPLLLSRTLDPSDEAYFEDEHRVLTQYALDRAPLQRRWEYGLALHAIARWTEREQRPPQWPIYLLGGEEPFAQAVISWTDSGLMGMSTVEAANGLRAVAGSPLADVILALSLLEHVHDLDASVYTLSCLVAPGGLLVLTVPYWPRCGPDRAAGWRERQRIFCPQTYAQLRTQLAGFLLTTFGGLDPAFHGVSRDDYTIASLVLEKRR